MPTPIVQGARTAAGLALVVVALVACDKPAAKTTAEPTAGAPTDPAAEPRYQGPVPQPDDTPEPPPEDPVDYGDEGPDDAAPEPDAGTPSFATQDLALQQAVVQVPTGRTIRVDARTYGHDKFPLETISIEDPDGTFEVHFEGGSSCARGEEGFDPEFPGSQNGRVAGAQLVEVLRDEGTPTGNRGAATVERDGEEFAIVAQCDDELGVICVAYRLAETQVELVEAICGSMRAR